MTVFCSPGSNRTEAPDGTLSRRPNESLRLNTNAGFVSKNAVVVFKSNEMEVEEGRKAKVVEKDRSNFNESKECKVCQKGHMIYAIEKTHDNAIQPE